MPVRIGNSQDKLTARDAYQVAVNNVLSTERLLSDWRRKLQNGTSSQDDLAEIRKRTVNSLNQLLILALTPGLQEAARDIEADPTYDFVGAISDFQTALQGVISAVDAVNTPLTFDPTATAPIRTAITALSAETVDRR